MANYREEALNIWLAGLLGEHEGLEAKPEARTGSSAIDISATVEGAAEPIPILMEAKIGDTPANRRAAARQARSRLKDRPRALAFALCYAAGLRNAEVPVEETVAAMRAATYAFAPVDWGGGEPTWREGSAAELAGALRNTDLSRRRVAEAIERTVREVADLLYAGGRVPALADALALPRTEKEGRATALIAALMLSNAALLHRRLRLVPAVAGIAPLEDALRPDGGGPAILREAWAAILAIDYHPVFAPALAALGALDDGDAREPVRWVAENAMAVADELASLRFDHAGPLYHRLLASARFDGSFYTNNVSALLLARLALAEESADWADADALSRLRIVDPACGSGTLLMAAMHAIRDRHAEAAGPGTDADPLHLAMVEDVLYGFDINRHGVQLAACNLTLGNPRVDYRRMNLFTMKHGPQPDGGALAGSLEMLAAARDEGDLLSLVSPLPTPEGLGAERVEPAAPPGDSLAGTFDLVIMNPPFTRNDLRNRQYDARARRALQEREIEIAETVKAHDEGAFEAIDQTSVATFFSPLADRLLKETGGTLAKVVPATALTNASGAAERRFLAERFHIDLVVTSHDPRRIAFSADTTIHESLVVARRLVSNGQRSPTRFVSLARMPRDAHEGLLLADLIARRQPLGVWGSEHSWPWHKVRKGDWSAIQFYDGVLADAMDGVASYAEAVRGVRHGESALVPLDDLCDVEPEGRRVRDAFLPKAPDGAPWTAPVLWDHPTDRQTTMEARADTRAAAKPGREEYARKLADKASRLLVANRIYTHRVGVTACYADEPMLGSAWTPVRPLDPDPVFEKALCAWWNSTPGVLTLLNARARKLTYPRYALDTLRGLLVPDPDVAPIEFLAEAFEKTRGETLLPWPQMHECPTRHVLDVAAAKTFGMDGRDIEDWRRRIAREPTVSGEPVSIAPEPPRRRRARRRRVRPRPLGRSPA